jgi:hypothetical protein
MAIYVPTFAPQRIALEQPGILQKPQTFPADFLA